MCTDVSLDCVEIVVELKVNDTLQEEAALASDLDGTNFTLENFTYTNNVIQTAIFNQLADTNFIGVTVSTIHTDVHDLACFFLSSDMYVYIIFVFVCVHSGRGEVQGGHQGRGSTESAADTTEVYWRI